MKNKKNFSTSLFSEIETKSGKTPQDCARNLQLMRNEYDRLKTHWQGQRFLVLLKRHMKFCDISKSELWKMIDILDKEFDEK